MLIQTRETVGDMLAGIQMDACDFFGVDRLPTDKEKLGRMRDWMKDQLRKAAWLDMMDEVDIAYADECVGAHEVVRVAREMLDEGK